MKVVCEVSSKKYQDAHNGERVIRILVNGLCFLDVESGDKQFDNFGEFSSIPTLMKIAFMNGRTTSEVFDFEIVEVDA